MACVPVILLTGRTAYGPPSQIISSDVPSPLGIHPEGARILNRNKKSNRRFSNRGIDAKTKSERRVHKRDHLRYSSDGAVSRPDVGVGAVLQRANELYEELQGIPSKVTRLKLDFLEQLLRRVEAKHIETNV